MAETFAVLTRVRRPCRVHVHELDRILHDDARAVLRCVPGSLVFIVHFFFGVPVTCLKINKSCWYAVLCLGLVGTQYCTGSCWHSVL